MKQKLKKFWKPFYFGLFWVLFGENWLTEKTYFYALTSLIQKIRKQLDPILKNGLVTCAWTGGRGNSWSFDQK